MKQNSPEGRQNTPDPGDSGARASVPPGRRDEVGESATSPWVFAVWAAAVIGLGLVMRFLFIGKYEIWLDEAYCFTVAKKGLGGMLADLKLDNGPPLYYLMLHCWIRLFGESILALRSLSAIFSAATVALVVFWRAPWFSRRARLVSGFVLAITPLAIYYAQEARMYSPVVFFAAASMVFLERGIRVGRVRDWVLFALFTALGLYTSYVAIFLVPAGYVVIAAGFAAGRDTPALKRRLAGLVAAHLAAATLFLPWLPTFLDQPRAQAIQWIERLPNQPKSAAVPLEALSLMTVGGANYPGYLRHLSISPERLDGIRKAVSEGRQKKTPLRCAAAVPRMLAVVLMVVLTLGAFGMAMSRRFGFGVRALLLSWLLLPIFVPLALSLGRPMYVLGRYEILAVPALAILTGLGLARIAKPLRVAALVAGALLFVYSWTFAQQSFSTSPTQMLRAEFLASKAVKGDIILAEAFEYAPIYYGMFERRDAADFMTYPLITIRHSAWIDYYRWLDGDLNREYASPELRQEAESTISEVIENLAPGGRLFFVGSKPPGRLPWAEAMRVPLFESIQKRKDALVFEPSLSLPAERILAFRRAE